MALIYYGMAILAIVGASAILYWSRKSQQKVTIGVAIMAAVLFVAGAGMIILGLTSS
jgi:hypothetical protein